MNVRLVPQDGECVPALNVKINNFPMFVPYDSDGDISAAIENWINDDSPVPGTIAIFVDTQETHHYLVILKDDSNAFYVELTQAVIN